MANFAITRFFSHFSRGVIRDKLRLEGTLTDIGTVNWQEIPSIIKASRPKVPQLTSSHDLPNMNCCRYLYLHTYRVFLIKAPLCWRIRWLIYVSQQQWQHHLRTCRKFEIGQSVRQFQPRRLTSPPYWNQHILPAVHNNHLSFDAAINSIFYRHLSTFPPPEKTRIPPLTHR